MSVKGCNILKAGEEKHVDCMLLILLLFYPFIYEIIQPVQRQIKLKVSRQFGCFQFPFLICASLLCRFMSAGMICSSKFQHFWMDFVHYFFLLSEILFRKADQNKRLATI